MNMKQQIIKNVQTGPVYGNEKSQYHRIFGNGKSQCQNKHSTNGLNGRLDTIEERITDLEHRDTKKVPRMWQRRGWKTWKRS